MKYKVEITETLQRVIELEAENEKEAVELTRVKHKAEEIVLGAEDCVEVEFASVSECSSVWNGKN